MAYMSFEYLLFVIVCLTAYQLMPRKHRWCVLLAASMGFYAIVCLKYIGFVLLTSASTFAGGLILERYHDKCTDDMRRKQGLWTKEEKKRYKVRVERCRKLIVAGILALNFGILAFLKYHDLFVRSVNVVSGHFGRELPRLDLFLPLGISFYTFQSMGYVIDIYRRKYPAQKNLGKMLLFTSFFPQIVQGPISFYGDLSEQLYDGHGLRFEDIKQGILLIVWGAFKKSIIADRLADTVRVVPLDYQSYPGTIILVTALFYAVQLYADFSGGIDISRGTAQLFGIDLAENFRRPYLSRSISEYWRRWHITLGAWMREYLFYPIAMSKLFQRSGKKLKQRLGIKVSKALPVCTASLLTFIVIGIWHGADWKYVAFGIWNGGIIMASALLEGCFSSWKERLRIRDENRLFIAFQMIRTFCIVLIGYYFDIAPHFRAAMEMMYRSVTDFHLNDLRASFLCEMTGLDLKELFVAGGACMVLSMVSFLQERSEDTLRERICRRDFVIQSLVFIILFWTVVIFGVYGPGMEPAEFIYMQF